jgi:broad specificity phosphatase PhoE
VAREDGEQVRAFFSEFGEVVAPGGESLGEAIDRFLSWWGEVRQELLGKSAAVVASGAMISGFAAAMLGMRLSRAVSLQLPHGGVGILDLFANGVRVSSWNPHAAGSTAGRT